LKKRILLGVIFLALIMSVNTGTGAMTADVEWHSSVKSGAKFTWKLTTVTTNDSGTEWVWAEANNLTLTQGDKIVVEWENDPSGDLTNKEGGPLNYTGMKMTVGDTELSFADDETMLYFLVAPLKVNNSLGKEEAGVWALERLGWPTYTVPDAFSGNMQYVWKIDCWTTNAETLAATDTIEASITSDWPGYNAADPPYPPEIYVADIVYDAKTALVKSVTYPSTVSGQDLADDVNCPTTAGLDALVIDFVPAAAPGFEAPIVVVGLIASAALVIIRRRR
jgi:hypothetical protein